MGAPFTAGRWEEHVGAKYLSVVLTKARYKIQDTRYKIQDTRYKIHDTRYKIQDNFIALYNKDYISTMYNKVKPHILDSKM